MEDTLLPLLSSERQGTSYTTPSTKQEPSNSSRGWVGPAVGGFFIGGVLATAALVGVLYNSPQDGLALPQSVQTELDNYLTGLGDATETDPLIVFTPHCDVNCGGEELIKPTELSSSDGKLVVELDVGSSRFKGPITFTTRSYGTGGSYANPGPTIRVKPGDSLTINLNNNLEFPTSAIGNFEGIDAEIMSAAGTCNPYGQPNMTSLHLHGMLVSVSSGADNVFYEAAPYETIQYHFEIPHDHPSGTYWYHPHQTESTSIQAAGLMGGMFIVEDTSDNTPPDFHEFLEHIEDIPVLVQWLSFTVSFGNFDFLSKCARSNMPAKAVVWSGIEDDRQIMTVNGQYHPNVTMTVGVPQRWRVVNGAAHQFIGLRFNATACSAYAIASDGIYYKEARQQVEPKSHRSDNAQEDDDHSDTDDEWNYFFVSLGSRVDIIMTCHHPGLVDVRSAEPDYFEGKEGYNWYGSDPGISVVHLMTINVLENENLDEHGRAVADDGYVYPDITDIKLPQYGYFGQDLSQANSSDLTKYEAVFSENANIVTMWYTMNGNTFTGRIAHRIWLNDPQEWLLSHSPTTSIGAEKSHNWHIHAFHFQIIEAVTVDGQRHTKSPTLDWVSGDFRDVVNVPRGGSAIVRFTPHLTTGLILHHCHIINHETGGLKEMISVVDCSKDNKVAMKEVCHGATTWPWAGFNCSALCSYDSSFMID